MNLNRHFWSLLIFAAACSHSPAVKTSAELSQRIVPAPPAQAFHSALPDTVTIAVVGINDFHGHVMPKERKLPDGRVIQSGGAPVLSAMLKILRDEMHGNVLIVDAGDEWQGTLESNQVQGSIVMDYFTRIGMGVATIGNHEFDFGIENLKSRMKAAPWPYVDSNIFERGNGKRIGSVQIGSRPWDNLYPSHSFTVGGIQIGVVGYSTQETPSTTRYDVVSPYEFRFPARYLEAESKSLRKKGASAVLLTSHSGTLCDRTEDLKDWQVWSAGSKQGRCGEDQETNRVFAKLAQGTLDGAIIGHTHQVVHHWIYGVPSIEDEAFNQHINILYLTFNRTSRKLIASETRIEGLIPICENTFERLHHCDIRRLADGQSPALEPAQFHGQAVVADADVQAWLQPILQSTEKYRKEVIAQAEMTIAHPADHESGFGNLVSDILREKAQSDFALVNGRGIRSAIDAGPITADALYRALPFDNILNTIRLNGKDLKMLMRIATSGAHDMPSTSGLRLTVIPFDRDAPKVDLDHDGKLDRWETNRLVEVTKLDGTPILDTQFYTVATFDFLVNGGDDLAWFMKRLRPSDISRTSSGFCRDLVSDYLRRVKVVNTREHPLLDIAHPRLILAK